MSSGSGREAIGFSNETDGATFQLRRGLMAQMAIGAIRVVARALVIPIADDASGEDQQRQERQRDSE